MTLSSGSSVLNKVSKYLIRPEDKESVSLASAPDNQSRLCRAWLLKEMPEHPDHEDAFLLVERNAPTPTNKFLGAALTGAKMDFEGISNLWSLFCPTAENASKNPKAMADNLKERRRLFAIRPSVCRLTDPATELLLQRMHLSHH